MFSDDGGDGIQICCLTHSLTVRFVLFVFSPLSSSNSFYANCRRQLSQLNANRLARARFWMNLSTAKRKRDMHPIRIISPLCRQFDHSATVVVCCLCSIATTTTKLNPITLDWWNDRSVPIRQHYFELGKEIKWDPGEIFDSFVCCFVWCSPLQIAKGQACWKLGAFVNC